MIDYEKYLCMDRLPHMWCPGCGNGILVKSIINAIEELKLNQDNVVIVSGIGCSSRAASYLNFDSIHTLHGRAIPVATGIKLAKPEINVIVITGDGDCMSIGGNHFIHGARRNIDLTVVIFNNNIYGMTGGQASPLTPHGKKATTAPYGLVDSPFDVCEVAKAAGATYVARATSYNPRMLTNLIADGINNKGFSVIEGITQCPTNYGRKNNSGDAFKMLQQIGKNSVQLEQYERLSEKEKIDKFSVGVFYNEHKPEYGEEYKKIIEEVKVRE